MLSTHIYIYHGHIVFCVIYFLQGSLYDAVGNDHNDLYVYVIQINTGVAYTAGTNSNIAFFLLGENGNTGIRYLDGLEHDVSISNQPLLKHCIYLHRHLAWLYNKPALLLPCCQIDMHE
jgi:hypothetical protein